MDKKQKHYETVPFPRMRHIVIDALRMGHRKHTVHGLLEADITNIRQYIRKHKIETGETLSFTAFIVSCLGKAVDENKHLHAYRNWRNQLILFEEVDISTIIEIELEDNKFPLAHIIRAANKRTFREIHEEIRSIQTNPQQDVGSESKKRSLAIFMSLPGFIRMFFYGVVSKNPHWLKKSIGTVGLTAIGMFGSGGGWAITMPVYNLSIALGGIAERLVLVDEKIETHEYLSITVSFDHDVIDGAPASRFTQYLKDLIESGYRLLDEAPFSSS